MWEALYFIYSIDYETKDPMSTSAWSLVSYKIWQPPTKKILVVTWLSVRPCAHPHRHTKTNMARRIHAWNIHDQPCYWREYKIITPYENREVKGTFIIDSRFFTPTEVRHVTHSFSEKQLQTGLTMGPCSRSLFYFKVARTYLYACWLCFWIAFFGRKDLTDFYDFWHP